MGKEFQEVFANDVDICYYWHYFFFKYVWENKSFFVVENIVILADYLKCLEEVRLRSNELRCITIFKNLSWMRGKKFNQ